MGVCLSPETNHNSEAICLRNKTFNSFSVPKFTGKFYSKSPFNAILFNRKFQLPFSLFSRDSSFTFTDPDDWYSLLVDSFVKTIKLKRAIQNDLAPFYSSQTIHFLIQKESLLRKSENVALFLFAIKTKDLNISLSNSLETDEKSFIFQFDIFSFRH